MSVSQLIPWSRNRNAAVAPAPTRDPILSLHNEMNRLFDELWSQLDMPRPGLGLLRGAQWPQIEMTEDDGNIVVSAELPGMGDKDVEVLVEDQTLILRGERRIEQQDNPRRVSERYYGRFERRVPLDAEVVPDQAKAAFSDGVLTVTLPKNPQSRGNAIRVPVAQAA
ncbi:Hsp20/alpha crystallin family protein [Coralloluteibacterium thermophilus]|uniref:Hsp20/alpha crystallin family protein n=1 Tax=Coralloluteibacterium thermophilum TaxID=2707049 RepID=A0ABV9NKD0_9GAMM